MRAPDQRIARRRTGATVSRSLAPAPGVAALHRAAPGRAGALDGLVAAPPAARRAAGGVRHRHRGRGRRRGDPRLAGRPADLRRRHVRRAAGRAAAPPGRRRQPRQPRVGVAQRPPDGRLRGAGRDRPPRATRPGQRPDHGARLRPRHHRAAAQHRHGLHRQRAGRAPRRAGRGRGAVPLLLVGAPPARRGVGLDALAAAGERGLAGPQHRRGALRPAPRRLRVPAGRGRARGEGAAAVRPVGLGGRPLRRPPPPPLRAAVAGHPAAGAVGGRLPGHRPRRQPRRVLGHRGRGGRRPDRPGRGQRVPADRVLHQRHRLRRAELGARRCRGPGRRRAAAGGGHGPGRRAAGRRPAGRRAAAAGDPLPRRPLRVPDDPR